MITAPYNFVPLNKEVFYPDWADKVSHDIPFEDGESGEIDITITAKSPIFVRDSKDNKKFCNFKGEYYIPGSSVKGMVRNVLEIISFSKMREESYVDNTYAVRDLRNKQLYMSQMKPQNIFCGWLKKDKEHYVLEDCGIPGRIKHEEIDHLFNIDFASKFKAKKGGFKNIAEYKTAKYKYELLKGKNLTQTFDNGRKIQLKNVHKKGSIKKGTLVLTGQASARKDRGKFDAKVYEFIFFSIKQELKLEKKVFENFKFAYFDGRDTEPKESPDWAYWKEKLQEGEKVPVFFQKDGNRVKHFGLSYLYKLPYTYSVRNGIPKSHFDDKADLAQTIFGYINKKNNDVSLKGRVQFSHFKAKNAQELPLRTEILGTPRASYYPIYIRQNNEKVYKTYMDTDFEIAGWKRYPIHKGNDPSKTEETGNVNVGTTFSPLKEEVVFHGKMRFHNLKKTELGALLSALTFHNTSGCYHNIGIAKSLGYGKIVVEIKNKDYISYLKEFEQEISKSIRNWIDAPQIKELLTMATQQNNSFESSLQYMQLTEFAKVKNTKESLKKYSELKNIKAISPYSTLKISNDLQTESVSKTKMRKALSETWNRVFKIFYHPNQIKEFLQGSFKTTPPEQAQVYQKLKDNKKFNTIIKEIDSFNKGLLSPDEVKKLYEVIVNLK